jgi:predicted PurR-regulated permease PerM
MGMLIAVPLAVCIKVALSHHPRLKPFALLMES